MGMKSAGGKLDAGVVEVLGEMVQWFAAWF